VDDNWASRMSDYQSFQIIAKAAAQSLSVNLLKYSIQREEKEGTNHVSQGARDGFCSNEHRASKFA